MNAGPRLADKRIVHQSSCGPPQEEIVLPWWVKLAYHYSIFSWPNSSVYRFCLFMAPKTLIIIITCRLPRIGLSWHQESLWSIDTILSQECSSESLFHNIFTQGSLCRVSHVCLLLQGKTNALTTENTLKSRFALMLRCEDVACHRLNVIAAGQVYRQAHGLLHSENYCCLIIPW